jgi:Tfp pilus assembly protein PilO
MTRTRAWTFGAAVVAVLIIIAAWFLAISPQRSEAADLRDQAAAQQQANEQMRLKTKQLQAQFASLPERQAQLAEIRQQMPDNPSLPALIRDLSSNAKAADVTLVSVSPGDPVPGLPTVGAAAADASTAQLLSIPTQIEASGTYAQLTLFLQKLQTEMRRAYLIENVELGEVKNQETSKGPLSMSLGGQIFVLNPDASADSTPTTPVAPATQAS